MTGSDLEAPAARTAADLAASAAAAYGDATAVRYKHDGEWRELSFGEVGTIVEELALGLIDLGIAPGDRVCILADTRPEWTFGELGGLGRRSGRRADLPDQLTGGMRVGRRQLRGARDRLRERGPARQDRAGPRQPPRAGVHDRDRARRRRRHPRRAARARPGERTARSCGIARRRSSRPTPTRSSTRPGRPGRRRAACSRTPTRCPSARWRSELEFITPADVSYLYLPLAHVFALTVQIGSFDVGTAIVYFGGDTRQIVAEIAECHPTYLPSVPRIFEKLYTVATAPLEQAGRRSASSSTRRSSSASRCASCASGASTFPSELARAFEQGRRARSSAAFAQLFGGRCARRSAARRRSRRRSSSSSTPRACRCSRAGA